MQETGYKIKNQEAIHYVTFSVVNWIDLFTRQVYKEIVVDNLNYCQREKGLSIYAWVIMSKDAMDNYGNNPMTPLPFIHPITPPNKHSLTGHL
ncbi:MAG: hypothetical protein K9H58_16490 [Bacteroidales bacterium]|nr:hypothetical protein [Bacteroidales bacterium]